MRIDPAQLAELSPEQKEKLRELWKPQKYDVCICNKYNEGHEVFVWSEFTSTTKEKKLELLYGGMGHHSATKQQCLPLLSIGQMIEILHDKHWIYEICAPQEGELNKGDLKHKDDDEWWETERGSVNPYNWQVYRTSVGFYNTKELVDALWAAFKAIL